MSEAKSSNSIRQITVTLLDQHYQVPCADEEQELLLEAVRLLNQQLEATRSRGKLLNRERAALMVAVNLAADLQRARQALEERERDLQLVEQRLQQLVDRARGSE
ncbi:cell division protein ZapA [Acidithiobacillus montserratensis]|uniref:Cell division protein ZapA n=1 Tax=Acidithiobacillus montserratensis TaxID=2729135 RepID=A0ACD5HDS2_9PROT|nr:cell division protein ZapA [Acidithiobacillaceae bacterium]MBU2749021.1 cell division protein ZapA [Acidithiobacillus montserratensis]